MLVMEQGTFHLMRLSGNIRVEVGAEMCREVWHLSVNNVARLVERGEEGGEWVDDGCTKVDERGA